MSFDQEAAHRNTMTTLMASVVPTTAAMAASYAAVAVLAEEITGSETLAGLAAASVHVGSVVTTVPLARRMTRLGRRRGLTAGWSIGAAGAALAFVAALADLYPLLVVGIVGIGAGNATNLAARFTAADLAPDDRRARAIGTLVWAGTLGAVAGPTIALGPAAYVARAIGLPELAGPYLLGVALFVVGLGVTQTRLRPDPLEVLGTLGKSAAQSASPLELGQRIFAVPAARLAVIAMLVGQAVMVGVMTMTPVHMKSGDQRLAVIGWVISLHVIGMYAFSPIVGWLVDRVGPHLAIGAGGVLLCIGAETSAHTSAEDSLGMFAGLLLVGLGWSFGLIAGSTLLTGAFPVSERVEVQGEADFLMTLGGAAAGLSAGATVEVVGFHSLSHWAGLSALLLLVAAAAAWYNERLRREKPVSYGGAG